MRLTRPVTARTALILAMVLCVVAYLSGLLLPAEWSDVVVNYWLALLTVWVPAAVCWLATTRLAAWRKEILFATAGVTAYAIGDTYYLLTMPADGSGPFPSGADAAYLLFYIFMFASLVAGIRRHARGLAWSVWLDSAIGAVGAAAMLAVLLDPVLKPAWIGPTSLAMATALAYPLADMVLVAAVVGIAALGGMRFRSRWGLLLVGLAAFAMADVVYALEMAGGVYTVGSPIDGAWAIGLALIALWVDRAGLPTVLATAAELRRSSRATALTVATVATAAGIVVLVIGARTHISTFAIMLAGVTLLGATVRTQVSFRQLTRMADLRRRDAGTDDLTGLPNRRALYDQGQARLTELPHRRRALLLLDLDRFKEVNDSLGHHAGDVLLIETGARLRFHLRAGDLLARLGGDEFAVLLEDVDRDRATAVAVKLRRVLAAPFALEGIALQSGVSIGIALFPEDGDDLNDLLRKADIAMYRAKASGVGHHTFSGLDSAAGATRLQTVQELRTALVEGELVLHYQPKVDLTTRAVSGVEALVRWNHPTRGLLLPDEFLTLVEEFGLMPRLTTLVLEAALDQVATWRARGTPLTVAVNLSASSLVDARLPEQVMSILAARGLPPGSLQLEITEQFLMADRDRSHAVVSRLRLAGVQISVDDFGTGYSSLSYLRDLPIDELKLDRSFIAPMAHDPHAAALVGSIIVLARSLGVRLVAEGVEAQSVFTALVQLGCDEAQGYFLSPPLPALELADWLATWRESTQPRQVSALRTASS